MGKKMISWVCLTFFLVALTSCATYQPLKPRVMLHPTGYPNFITVEGISIAAVPFSPNRSMYADPSDPNPNKPPYNLLEAGVCPVRLIFVNESSGPVFIDPSQMSGTDVNGVTYQPFGVDEAGDAIVASQAFQSWVKGAVAGAVAGSLIGAALGAAIGGAIGGHDSAGRGAIIGGVTGGAAGAAEGGGAFRLQMERQMRDMLARDTLKELTLYQNMKRDGVVLFPAVNLQTIQILLEDPESDWSRLVEIPIAAGQ